MRHKIKANNKGLKIVASILLLCFFGSFLMYFFGNDDVRLLDGYIQAGSGGGLLMAFFIASSVLDKSGPESRLKAETVDMSFDSGYGKAGCLILLIGFFASPFLAYAFQVGLCLAGHACFAIGAFQVSYTIQIDSADTDERRG